MVVYQTDNSSRFSIDSKNNYYLACGKHTKDDRVIDEKAYDRIISDINAHAINTQTRGVLRREWSTENLRKYDVCRKV